MGGWLEAPPGTVTEVSAHGVAFQLVEPATLLNRDDPDVSFAYSFCGSIGISDGPDGPQQTAERGRQKARWAVNSHLPPDVAGRLVATVAPALPAFSLAPDFQWTIRRNGAEAELTDLERVVSDPAGKWTAEFTLAAATGEVSGVLTYHGGAATLSGPISLKGKLKPGALEAAAKKAAAKCAKAARAICAAAKAAGVAVVGAEEDTW